MIHRLAAVFVVLVCAAYPGRANANVVARVDISEQRLHLYVNGAPYATWRVSTARRGYRTPTGSFRPQSLHRQHYSSRYHNSPMPYSVFFHGGYAIHGTYELRYLGRPVSHGCIRLHPRNAAVLFNLIRRHGASNTRIVVAY